ncbi:tRNA (adenosine(37)-N6)-threonylcarbamoyltransferase complex ATPase subunit type 1 TsaE [uncultured Algibacter sp.]|uniref:tRNA (adenosine(37)-N6)-threonylcarbamoyltransferase complex ATPase subunit type 1 TsaE n=1 Tax=uncultured Algibacter sp. TaxID=298659 RepID=UPI002625B23B|nr:tRNA (adenosine(37)-N6)-threonylcarbamoyltransferase complex ATPase subunit type 1 TsaE [uncultured Algibacter sp.]
MEIVYILEDIKSVAQELINSVTSKKILLYGDIGVGKTTLVKAITTCLSSDDEVSSPTFSIVNEYEIKGGLLYHFDFYRIKDLEEAYNFGIEDYLFSDAWCIMEWPEKVKSIVPEPYDVIRLELNMDGTRTLKLNRIDKINHKTLLSKQR